MAKLRVTIMDQYLFSQVFSTVLFALVLFTIIWLAPDVMFKLIQKVVNRSITFPQGLELFLLHIPSVFQQTMPISALIGSLFVFQRLSQNFELIVMFAAGISRRRVLYGVLGAGLVFFLFHAAIQELVTPVAMPALNKANVELGIKDARNHNFLYVDKDNQGTLDKLILVGDVQKDHLGDFVVLYFDNVLGGGARVSRILKAKRGVWNPETSQWQLFNGKEYASDEEGVYRTPLVFKEQQVRTDKYAARLLSYSRLNPQYMNFENLNRYIQLLEEGGQYQDVPYYSVRLFQKFTAPLATLLFMIVGCYLGMEKVRSNRTYGLTFGALIVFVYSVLSPFANNLANFGVLPPWIVAWLPLSVSMAFAVMIIKFKSMAWR